MSEIRSGPLPHDFGVPEVGQYYRNISGDEGLSVPEHGLALVIEADEHLVLYAHYDERYQIDTAEWRRHFVPAPDGSIERQNELQELLRPSEEQQDLAGLISRGAAALTLPTAGEEAGDEATGTALQAISQKTAAEVRERTNVLKKRAERLGLALKEKQTRIQAIFKEQAFAVEAQAAAAKQMLEKSRDTMAALDLYLGNGHEAHLLLSGEPAGAEEPFHFHQRVLFMDEETAAVPEADGIDIRDMAVFDEWVKDPENLRRVLPEPRGIVAFQVRRGDKRYYEDPLLNWFANDGAGHDTTYLLIRNGERLMRLFSGFQVRDRLMPIRSEWEDCFKERGFRDTTTIRPGDPRFRRAIEAASGLQRYYMSVLLLVQGIIDRTKFLEPLPEGGINLFNVYDERGPVRFVADAEESLMLPLPRLPFNEWRREVQKSARSGMRVAGRFGEWTGGLRAYNYEKRPGNERLSPPTTHFPSDEEIYTLQEAADGTLSFLYARTVYDYDLDERVPAGRRSRCTLEVGDSFWLPIDNVSEEDILYYLSNRTDRHRYREMFPLLKRVLATKRAEREAEAPFREMLVGEVMKALPGLGRADVEPLTDECVTWYKFSNQTHRALLEDDEKALRLIVSEAVLRHRREDEMLARASEGAEVVRAVRSLHPDVLLIAHKRGNQFIAFLPENQENVYVREQVWTTAAGREPLMKEERRWRMSERRHERWGVLHEGRRWSAWDHDVRPEEHLTDPEIDAAIPLGWSAVERGETYFRQYPEHQFVRPIGVYRGGDRTLVFVYQSADAEVPEPNRLLTGRWHAPAVYSRELRWQRTRDGLGVAPKDRYDGPRSYSFRSHLKDGEAKPIREQIRAHGDPVWFDADVLAEVEAQIERVREFEAARESFEKPWPYMFQVTARMKDDLTADAYRRWMAEHDDEALWPAHEKTLGLKVESLHHFPQALSHLIEAGVDVAGRTVGDVIGTAEKLGAEFSEHARAEFARLPMDHVLVAPAERKLEKPASPRQIRAR